MFLKSYPTHPHDIIWTVISLCRPDSRFIFLWLHHHTSTRRMVSCTGWGKVFIWFWSSFYVSSDNVYACRSTSQCRHVTPCQNTGGARRGQFFHVNLILPCFRVSRFSCQTSNLPSWRGIKQLTCRLNHYKNTLHVHVALTRGKQNLRANCPTGKLEFKFFWAMWHQKILDSHEWNLFFPQK